MKTLLIPICLLFLSYGCSKESPTSTEPTEPTLDTTTKESSGSRTIERWNGDDWIDTGYRLSVDSTWRFISYLDRADGGVDIKGGYTLDMSNPSDNDVEFEFNKFFFKDKDGIPIHEYTFYHIERLVSANGTARYSGTFEIDLDNIDIANQITRMTLWGSASIPVE
jgi:hypothetical protein